jgi:dihydrofolate synthase / folylpolyglutamate synthase
MLTLESSLENWLKYIASVHPREIDLGLERIHRVARRLKLAKPAAVVITVAGTNGKGSCVATLEAVLQQAGYKTGAYTSPHIQYFNERIRVAAAPVADQDIVAALAEIDRCREDESLSYFEFATLAALLIFKQAGVDVALLEVGLGGRLDAVNIIDPDVALITNISIDHEDWLGKGVENIGAEKAGILRANTAAVFGDTSPPASIVGKAKELGARLYVQGTDFRFSKAVAEESWQWFGVDGANSAVHFAALELPRLALANVSAALQALILLPLQFTEADINGALKGLQLAGRFEIRRDRRSAKTVIFDVAHNQAAAALLAENLALYRQQNPAIVQLAVVIAVLADKDIEAMVTALESCTDIWYIAQVDEARGMAVEEVAQRIKNSNNGLRLQQFGTVGEAYRAACEQTAGNDLIVVTGSFFTVAAVRALSSPT